MFKALKEHPNAKIFISSRTEDDISSPFSKTINDEHVKHIHLDTSAQSSIDDVGTYLKRRLVRIVEDNGLDWEVWPGDERLLMLVNRASGLFIWAVTAVNFLEQQIDILGTECLDDVLVLLNSHGMMDISTLYHIILRLTHTATSHLDWEYEKFRRIVGAIIVLQEPPCLSDLNTLLELCRFKTSAPVDIVKFARRLRTVLVPRTDTINPKTIPRLHKSFLDFITSEHADLCFRIDQELARAELAHQPDGLPTRLDSFRKYCSKWDSAHGWLSSSRMNLLSYISSRENLNTDDKDVCTGWARGGLIYLRSTIYAYELLKLRADNTAVDGQLAALAGSMRIWSSWDVVEAVSKHRMVRDYLHTLINPDQTEFWGVDALEYPLIFALPSNVRRYSRLPTTGLSGEPQKILRSRGNIVNPFKYFL